MEAAYPNLRVELLSHSASRGRDVHRTNSALWCYPLRLYVMIRKKEAASRSQYADARSNLIQQCFANLVPGVGVMIAYYRLRTHESPAERRMIPCAEDYLA